MVFLWILIDAITKTGSEFKAALNALLVLFNAFMILMFLMPASEYTSDAVIYAVALVEQHCGDSTNVGYFHWLDKLQLGWTLLSVQVNRKTIARVFYVLIITAMTGGSRYLTS